MKTEKIKKRATFNYVFPKIALLLFLVLALVTSCSNDDGDDEMEDEQKELTLDNLTGSWIRIASNNIPNDGIIIEMNDAQGEITDKAGSSFSNGDIKWKDIAPSDAENYTYEELGSDNSYYNAFMELKEDDTLRISVGSSGAGNIQKWVREGEYTPISEQTEETDPLLEALEIDCATHLAAGETMTLENRNDGVDYIINCVFGTYGDFVIAPGVTIQFGTDAGINVFNGGSIQALGTAVDPIVFTGEDKVPGAWKGVFINSNDLKNKIEYATIEYAGGEAFNSNGDKGGVIVYADTHLNMNNTTITNSETYGLNANYGGCELVLEDNVITSCEAPMYIEGSYATTISGGDYTGNTLDAIIIVRDFIIEKHTWTKLNVPYHLPTGMDVTPGGELTIMPGVVMMFGQDSRLYINEGAGGPKPSLIAVGTVEEPIVFTSIDDTLSGWKGIYFDSPSTLNEIGFATIENASNTAQNGAITNWSGTVLNVHDVLFKDIKYCAIQYMPIGVTISNLSYDNVGTELCED